MPNNLIYIGIGLLVIGLILGLILRNKVLAIIFLILVAASVGYLIARYFIFK